MQLITITAHRGTAAKVGSRGEGVLFHITGFSHRSKREGVLHIHTSGAWNVPNMFACAMPCH